MAYIVMGKDECNTEFRPSSKKHDTEDAAIRELHYLREQYQEARALWVEPLMDNEFFKSQYQVNEWEYF